VSLRFATVNARGGPGDDYKQLWVYRARGAPLQVIAETSDWRRVCDSDGGVAWVLKRMVETRRTVMRASEDAPVVAVLVARSLAELDRCDKGWCRLIAGRTRGWARAGEVWGTAEAPACGPERARRSGG